MREACEIRLPWWLVIIVILETLPMFIGPYVALTLPGFMGGPGAESINQAAFIYSARNIAVGIALIAAVLLRNAPMLFILIFVRLITDIGDLPTLLSFGLARNPGFVTAIFVFLYYIPALIALRYLWRKMLAEEPDQRSRSAT